jgi:hypothetical protein
MKKKNQAPRRRLTANRAPRGVCRFCGCTEITPCVALLTGECCAWADRTLTLCTNPKCLAKARRVA